MLRLEVTAVFGCCLARLVSLVKYARNQSYFDTYFVSLVKLFLQTVILFQEIIKKGVGCRQKGHFQITYRDILISLETFSISINKYLIVSIRLKLYKKIKYRYRRLKNGHFVYTLHPPHSSPSPTLTNHQVFKCGLV
jgi:hypothetical protein